MSVPCASLIRVADRDRAQEDNAVNTTPPVLAQVATALINSDESLLVYDGVVTADRRALTDHIVAASIQRCAQISTCRSIVHGLPLTRHSFAASATSGSEVSFSVSRKADWSCRDGNRLD
uniref:Uncharacterized protein n=1 Tax=Plectus sambesii TaxID=2011161 RepID=A0A914V0J0_9BILA